MYRKGRTGIWNGYETMSLDSYPFHVHIDSYPFHVHIDSYPFHVYRTHTHEMRTLNSNYKTTQ